jgi:hypothetical protein
MTTRMLITAEACMDLRRPHQWSADRFVANEPLNKAGVYQRVEIHR